VVEGDTVIVGLLPGLLDHAYTPAPEAVRVVLLPLQIVVIPLIPAVGSEFTVTVAVSLSVQPFPFVTVTVYVVVMTGETVIEVLLPRLFDQINTPAPEATRVVLLFRQIVVMPLITARGD
jgi:hypothetical protein